MSREWYLYENDEVKGPYAWGQLQEKAGSGQLGPATWVWKAGMSDWARAGQRQEFSSLLGGSLPGIAVPAAPAAPPTPTQKPRKDKGRSAAPSGGRGLLIALISVLVLVLLGGTLGLAYYLTRDDSEDVAQNETNGDELAALMGPWRIESAAGDQGMDFATIYYMKLEEHGILHYASETVDAGTGEPLLDDASNPDAASGYRFATEYQLTEADSVPVLEFINPLDNSWDVLFEITLQQDQELILRDPHTEQLYEATRIRDQEFQAVITRTAPME